MSQPEDTHFLTKKANESLHERRWSEAEQTLIKIKALNPDNDKMIIILGELYQKQNKYIKSHKSFKHILSNYLKITTNNVHRSDIHYQFGELLLSINKPKKALKHFDHLIINNPNNINYIIQNAKTSSMLKYYTKAEQLFNKALQITNENDPNVIFEYGLYFKKYRKNNEICMFYIDFALKLDPTNIKYKYEYLTIKYNKYDMNTYLAMHSPEYNNDSDIKYKQVKNIIKIRSELLVSGYTNNPSNIIPMEIQRICYQFLMGNCLIITAYDFVTLSPFGLNEIISTFFDVLCPGCNEAISIFSIRKIIGLIKLKHSSDNMKHVYSNLLLSIIDITNIYNQLSMIECTKKYINILLNKIPIFVDAMLLDKLFTDNNKFCELYLKNPMRDLFGSCWYLCASIIHDQYPISLHTIRIFLSPWIKTNNTLSTIKDLTDKISERVVQLNFEYIMYCVFIHFLKLEIECLNKTDINYDIQIVLDEIVDTLWNKLVNVPRAEIEYLQETDRLLMTWMNESHSNILKILLECDIDLKPCKMSWDIFYEKMEKTHSSQIDKALMSYFQQKSIMNDGLKDKWTYCISVLDSKSYDSNS